MISREEQRDYSRKLLDEGRGNHRRDKGFNYPVRVDGETCVIFVHKMFQKKELSDRDYNVVVDLSVYNRLKDENRRLFVHPYIGGQWHRHDNVVRITVDMTEKRPDNIWALSWYVLGHRPEKGILADHINGDDLDNRRVTFAGRPTNRTCKTVQGGTNTVLSRESRTRNKRANGMSPSTDPLHHLRMLKHFPMQYMALCLDNTLVKPKWRSKCYRFSMVG